MDEKYSAYAISDMYRFLEGKYRIAKKCLKLCEEDKNDEEVLDRYRDTMRICEKFIKELDKLEEKREA